MSKLNFYFGLVLVTLMMCGVSVKAETSMVSNSVAVNTASNGGSSAQTPVKFMSGIAIQRGHSYTGWAAVTVRLKNGNSYVEHYTDLIIDYGLVKKCIKVGSLGTIEYDSKCEFLEYDIDAAYYVSRFLGGDDVAYILVELAVKQVR